MSQAGKTDKVAQGYRTPQWENSKLWSKKSDQFVDLHEKVDHVPDVGKKVECTCASWCLMDRLPEDACCHGSECECEVREVRK